MATSTLIYEEWKDIKGYEGLYQVSSFGRVKSLNYHKTGAEKLLKQGFDKDGYKQLTLYKNRHKKNCKVHRLVAEAFIDNPNNYPIINHRNEFKFDNSVYNLEWCDEKYNSNYGSRNIRLSKSKQGAIFSDIQKQRISIAKKISVYQLSMNNEIIRKWDGIVDASRELNIGDGHISGCCKGKYKTAGGYKWRYVND